MYETQVVNERLWLQEYTWIRHFKLRHTIIIIVVRDITIRTKLSLSPILQEDIMMPLASIEIGKSRNSESCELGAKSSGDITLISNS